MFSFAISYKLWNQHIIFANWKIFNPSKFSNYLDNISNFICADYFMNDLPDSNITKTLIVYELFLLFLWIINSVGYSCEFFLIKINQFGMTSYCCNDGLYRH